MEGGNRSSPSQYGGQDPEPQTVKVGEANPAKPGGGA